jgi:hypothetical protein
VRVSKAARKDYEFIVIAARYQEGDHSLEISLEIAQVYQRRGPIWGDVVMLNRKEIIERIEEGDRGVIGRIAEIEGDFEVFGELRVVGTVGPLRLAVDEREPVHDDLQVPLF